MMAMTSTRMNITKTIKDIMTTTTIKATLMVKATVIAMDPRKNPRRLVISP